MNSSEDEVRERIARLSELEVAVQENLVDLREKGGLYPNFCRAVLQETIKTLQSELAQAKRELHSARGLDAEVEMFAKIKMQAREGWRTTKWAKARH